MNTPIRNGPPSAATPTHTASRIYAAALVMFPRHLRVRYGDEMRATFAARAADAESRGSAYVFVLLAQELSDLAVASAAARRRPPSPAGLQPQVPSPKPPMRNTMSRLLADTRYAIRMLRRQPGFAVVATLTLALGIGANTAVFTVVNGVLLRPLPYHEPERLVQLFHGRNGRLSMTYSPPNFIDITTQSGVFSGATAVTPSTANVTGNGEPELVDGANVTPSFFNVIGVSARLGRGLIDADGDNADVVVISDGLWRRRFGARTDAVGSTMLMDGKPFTIIGVAPADLRIPAGTDYWRPLVFKPRDLSNEARGAQWIGGIARLKPGVTLEQAKSAMALVAERLARDFPRTNKDRVMTAMGLQDRIVRNIRPALLILLGAVTLVMLVACVNVANLLLARASGRTREVSVRAALGAGRGRLVQQFLVESVLLGLAGGVGGLVVAWWATQALIALGPASIPRLADVGLDWRVLAFTIGVAVLTSVVFGLIPALAATSSGVAKIISTGRGSIGASSTRVRKALVVCEMALAVVLLVGAGLLIRSYQHISVVNPGFSPDHVITFTVALPEQQYKTSEAAGRFMRDLIARVGAHPGVEHAAGVYGLPLDDTFGASSSFTRIGETDSADSPSAGMRIVTPGYFATLKIPLKSGRLFDEHDDEYGPEVVAINEEAARRYWPGVNPLGQQLHLGVRLAEARSGMKTIVAVVGDVKSSRLDATAAPEVYVPYAQHPVDSLTIAVRTAGNPAGFVPTARADLASLDRNLPLAGIRTMDDVIGRSIAERRFTMLLLATFAVVAVLLAAIGVYGVLAYLVSQRTQEIGVRLAIGATPSNVVGLFVREGAMLMAIGVACGIGGALLVTRALSTLLFGVTTTDPITFATVAGTLTIVALLASYVPARRAARVDPMTALRAD
jgi:putative ABC transport system permease protein